MKKKLIQITPTSGVDSVLRINETTPVKLIFYKNL